MSMPMAAWRAHYTPGEWLVLSGPTMLLVMTPPPARATGQIETLWREMLQAPTAEAIVGLVAEVGLAQCPDLAALLWDEAGLHGLTRGVIRLIDADTGQVVLHGSGTLTWREENLGRERRLRVDLGVEADVRATRLPLVVGGVFASEVGLTTVSQDLVRFAADARRGVLAEAYVDTHAQPETPPAQPVMRAESESRYRSTPRVYVAEDALAALPVTPVEPVVDVPAEKPVEAEVQAQAEPFQAEPFQSEPFQSEPAQVDAPEEAALFSSRHLADPELDEPEEMQSPPPHMPLPDPVPSRVEQDLGSSVYAPQPEYSGVELPSLGLSSGPVMPLAPETDVAALNADTEGGGLGLSLPPQSAPSVVPPRLGEVQEDEGTIFAAGLAATHKPPVADPSEPQVLAVPCVNSHANPPGTRTCRVCHAPVDGSNSRLIRRPVLAGVHTNKGEFVDIVNGVIVGRAPDMGSGPAGSHLLRVISPSNDISRNHVLITTKDWSIMVTDLHSTNGTTVVPVGEPPFTIRDGMTVEVEVGTVMDLGDGVSLRIEPPRG